MKILCLAAATALLPGYAAAQSIDIELLRLQVSEQYAQTTARPLFAPDRQPDYVAPVAVPVVAKAPPPPPPAPDFDEMTFTLTGVVARGSTHIAMLQHALTGEMYNVTEGQAELPGLEPAQLVSIEIIDITAEEVTLEGEDGFAVRLSVRNPYEPQLVAAQRVETADDILLAEHDD